MSHVTVFKGAGNLTAKDADAFRAAGWKVGKAGRGLKLTGAVTKNTLHALNKAGFWWEVSRNPHAPSDACCMHHMDQLKRMPKRKAKKVPVKNPKLVKRGKAPSTAAAVKKAEKKAAAWYQNRNLVTKARVVKRKLPEAFVEVGTIAAIEYESDKFDGEDRLYRHEVTKKRKLYLSVDGSTMIVQPPFKITKRGIEG